MQKPLNEASAKALLVNARERGIRVYGNKLAVMALPPLSFIAVLKANPELISWEKMPGLNYEPFALGARILITDDSLESAGFREKICGPWGGSYLAPPRPNFGEAAQVKRGNIAVKREAANA